MKLFRTNTKHPEYAIRAYPLKVGEKLPVTGNFSECMMHIGLADKQIHVELRYSNSGHRYAQAWVDGREYSGPITTGEAGFYYANHLYGSVKSDLYYAYVDESRLTPEQIATIRPVEEEEAWLASMTGTASPGCNPLSTPMVAEAATGSPTESEPPSKSTPSLPESATESPAMAKVARLGVLSTTCQWSTETATETQS